MPKRIGDYELGDTIGKGKYSVVKYCRNVKTSKHYAIKVMKLKDIKQGKMEKQLRREIAIMKMIKHPNVIKLHEVLQTSNNIYIVMDLVTGGELFDKIVSVHKFTEKMGRRYFHQLVSGLSYCHRQGIAHRDLKPENLLLDDSGVLKISDFGLSTLAKDDRETLLKTTCGTPCYVSPDVLAQKGYNGFKSDIWSIGVILFVMLAGYLPFDDKNVHQLFRKIEDGKYKTPDYFSKDLKDLLKGLLNVNPNKRLNMKQIKTHRWFKVGFKDTEQEVKVINVSKSDIDRSISGLEEMVESQKKKDKKKKKKRRRYIESEVEEEEEGEEDSEEEEEEERVRNQEDEEEGEGEGGEEEGNIDRTKPKVNTVELTDAYLSGKKKEMNAFELCSMFMKGNVACLATGSLQNIVKRKTRFLTNKSFKQTQGILFKELHTMELNPELRTDKKLFKCRYDMKGRGVLSFRVVIIKLVGDKATIVEFQRRRGSSYDFYEVYRDVVRRLADIICEKGGTKNPNVNPLILGSPNFADGEGGQGEIRLVRRRSKTVPAKKRKKKGFLKTILQGL